MLSGILIILRRNRGDNIQWFLSKYTDVDSEILYVHKHNLMTVSHNPGPPTKTFKSNICFYKMEKLQIQTKQ